MKNELILEAMGMIDDNLIADAKKTKKHNINIKRIAVTAAAIGLFVTAPLPAATVYGSDEAYNVLYHIAPSIAQTFKPVRKSCIDNGIKMEVIFASIDSGAAEIYIALQDTEQDRIDETIDLFDSYYINCPYDSACHCSFSEYDKETKTAYFIINIKRMDGKPIKNNKITFSLKEMLFNKKTVSEILDIDMKNIPKNPETHSETNDLRGYSRYSKEGIPNYKYINPNKTPLCIPAKGVEITGIGYIDGALHIQTYYEDISKTDNHGFISLIDENGNEYNNKNYTTVSFWDENHKGSYDELIIDIPYDEIGKYKLFGEFIISQGYTKGNWQVTFSLGDVD